MMKNEVSIGNVKSGLLSHTFELLDQEFIRYDLETGKIWVKPKNTEEFICTNCLSTNVKKSGVKERVFRTIPIGRKPVFLLTSIQRLECMDCGMIRQAKIGFADNKKSYTIIFRRLVHELRRLGTTKDIANHLGISWDLVKDIQNDNYFRSYSKPDITDVECIAIEEFKIKDGRSFTIVVDMKTGRLLFDAEGKGTSVLDEFWRRVKRNKIKIKAATVDFSPSYITSVARNSPGTEIFYDIFN
jgi:transposase